MPVRLVLTEGTSADCTQAPFLTADLAAQYLLADRGYAKRETSYLAACQLRAAYA